MKRIFLIFTTLLFFQCSAGGDFATAEEPIHIQLSLKDKKDGTLFLYGRLVLFAEQRRALFFFVNTEARKDVRTEPFRKGLGVFGDPLKEITGKGQDYSISLGPEELARIIDLTEGLEFFVEEPVVFDGGRFQYPAGVQLFSGKQAVEYLLAKGRFEKGSEYLADIDRLFRAESVLMNMLWQLPRKRDRVEKTEQVKLLHSLLDTNLSLEQFHDLITLFVGDRPFDVSVMEAPLELGTAGFGEKALIFNANRAAALYNDYVQSLSVAPDGFPVQILNGTDINRLASRVKDLIHNRGVRVLKTDNYRHHDVQSTLAVEHSGDFRKARLLMELLGLSEDRLYFRRRVLDLHATVIMGRDFNMKSLLK